MGTLYHVGVREKEMAIAASYLAPRGLILWCLGAFLGLKTCKNEASIAASVFGLFC